MSSASITIPKTIAKRLREDAEKLGMSSDEYLVELVTHGLDPRDKAREYIKVAKELLEQSREELEKEDIRQAAEKIWGATALAVKAYAYWREGKRLASHGELWRYIDIMEKELGEWIRDAFYAGHAMHTCFYEGWCTRDSVKASIHRVKRLVKEIDTMIKTKTLA